MGAGLARFFAAAGHAVAVYDERAGVAAEVGSRVAGVEAASSVAAAARDAELAVEAVTEQLEAKQAVMLALAAATQPSCVLATNTSALSVDAIACCVPVGERPRVAGAHFFNPPDVVPAVEVVRGAATSAETVDRLVTLLQAAGKVTAVVADSPGFVANRIQHAMIVEAWRCLEEGVASAEDIDAIVSASFGFRLFAYGPFQLGDFNGLDVYAAVMESLESAYGERFRVPPTLLARVERGELGVKSGAGVFSYADGRGAALIDRRDQLLKRLAALREAEL